MFDGRSFHTMGATLRECTITIILSHYRIHRWRLQTNLTTLPCWSLRKSTEVNQVSEVDRRCDILNYFISNSKDFETNPLFDWQPMKIPKHRSNTLPNSGSKLSVEQRNSVISCNFFSWFEWSPWKCDLIL